MDNFFVSNAYWVLLFPLISFVLNGLYLGRKNWKMAASAAVVLNVLSLFFVLNIALAYYNGVIQKPGVFPFNSMVAWEVSWLNFSSIADNGFDLTASIGVFLDPISVMMLIVITVISVLVNIYSIGYMKDDPGAGRFFALLSLFTFSMLGLVCATNIFQMFVFWELVGISSYLLIGFWYQKPSAVAASKKAFIVTRFADAFFLMGIIIVSYYTKTFDFLKLNSPETIPMLTKTVSFGFLTVNLLTLGTLLIFTGGWGKSAMFPLHIWLPDAMEGPTPVSAIIHSATMVVAGVFLTARMFPLFAASSFTLHFIEFIGAFTAVFAAIIACTQTDIKRILAFSTLSQLGYMILALGTAKMVESGGHEGLAINALGYTASMFHIFTHAFFKCMLFLMAGQVIHIVHTNDIWKMGGLRKGMPLTFFSCLIACLAIAGIFPFSGFWSKDEIILAALQGGHYLTFGVGLIVGGLTAFYMFRLFFVVFLGKTRGESEGHSWHIHQEPFMTFSIVVLAVPSLIIGWLAKNVFHHYVTPALTLPETHLGHPSWLPYVATLAGLLGIAGAWFLYARDDKFETAGAVRKATGKFYLVVQNKFYIDEVYLFVTHKIIFKLIAAPIKWFDKTIVDGTMNFVGGFLRFGGIVVRLLQAGQVQFYLGVTLSGLFLLYWLGGFPL